MQHCLPAVERRAWYEREVFGGGNSMIFCGRAQLSHAPHNNFPSVTFCSTLATILQHNLHHAKHQHPNRTRLGSRQRRPFIGWTCCRSQNCAWSDSCQGNGAFGYCELFLILFFFLFLWHSFWWRSCVELHLNASERSAGMNSIMNDEHCNVPTALQDRCNK